MRNKKSDEAAQRGTDWFYKVSLSIKQNVLIRLVSSIRCVVAQDPRKMKCTAVRKRDERKENEYERETVLQGKAG